MEKLKNEKGIVLKTVIIIVLIFIVIMFIAEMINQSEYREEQREKIIAYNETVEEYNEVIRRKNEIVAQYPYIGVTFKEALLVPESIADASDINSIYDQLMYYKNENNSIAEYNEEQLKIGEENIEKYDLIIENIQSFLQNSGL